MSRKKEFTRFDRMLIEKESPEEYGYQNIKYNLSESAITDLNLGGLNVDFNNILLCYGPHQGRLELRKLVAEEYDDLMPEHILITNGAAEALFIVAFSLLKPGDHVILEHPNYPSNYRVPRFLECKVDLLRLPFENRFKINLNELENLMTEKTKLVSLTHPNNPTGSMVSRRTLKSIVELVESHDCYLLFDETYRDLTFGRRLPHAASLSPKAISVSTLSKAYGAPGIRIGHIAMRDSALIESFLAAKEHINICNSVVDEEIALALLKEKDQIMAYAKKRMETNLKVLNEWVKRQKDLEYVEPEGGLVCLPRIKEEIPLSPKAFYEVLLRKYSTLVGPGHWFDMDDRYFRIGYGWPSKENLEEGLKNITIALEEAKIGTH